MTPFQAGSRLAFSQTKLADTYPDEYNAAGNFGAIGGGVAGAAGGAALGEQVARHLGRITRQKHLLMPIPGTGMGERIFSASPGPVAGQALGALAGGAAGAGLGQQGGHLMALRRSTPHRLINDQNQIDPNLLAYLSE